MAAKILMLRSKLGAKRNELNTLTTRKAGLDARDAELEQAIAEAEEVSPTLESQIEALATEQAEVDQAISAATAAISDLENAISAAEAAAADAIETAIETDGDGMNAGEAVAGIRPGGARRSIDMRARQTRAAEFQRTGRQLIKDVRGFVRSAFLNTDTSIAKPIGVDGINDGVGLNQVSSIIDMVHTETCTGMGTHRVPYELTDASEAADYSTRGTVPSESYPTFGYVDLTPGDHACISFIDKGIRKVSPLEYEDKIHASARTALRKKLSKICVNSILASSLNTTLSVTSNAFTPTFLTDLILSYGGDEEIEGNAVLFLTKADLKALAAIRGKNEYLPVYTINPDGANPNTGIIKDNYGLSCRYCLNKNLTSLSTSTRGSSAIKTMFYGNPQACELDFWGDLDVDVSEGYKFGEGLLTVRGEVTADADVVVKNGFVVVTLAATSS